MKIRLLLFGLAAALVATYVPAPLRALQIGTLPNIRLINFLCPNSVMQSFPSSGPAETTWVVCWHEVAGYDSIDDPNGLAIGPVYFRKAPGAPLVRVLWDMRVADYFVPYHPGSPRFYDLSAYNFQLTGLTADDCPAAAGGTLLNSHVCKEVHDRGLLWKDYTGVRRGEELVLWGVINADNYRYIQQYAFLDDGAIVALSGASGQNLPGMETVAHTHNAIWRIDIDVDGTANNATLFQHNENPSNSAGTASDTFTPISTAGGFLWSPRLHTSIAVSNPSFKNARGDLSKYELIPLVTAGGLTQHYEAFTQKDFWVTPYNFTQFAPKNLPSYIAASPSVSNRDIVLWYKGSLHHLPRDEDGEYQSGVWMGTALAFFTGFMLEPNDVFDCTPFYKPC